MIDDETRRGGAPAPLPEPLPRAFFARPADVVGRELLGMLLVHEAPDGTVVGRLVETEAYFGPGDAASHAHRGPTPRARIMFGSPGVAYVYFTYGMYDLLNVVADADGTPGAVLMRAVEPVLGAETMRRRRDAWAAARGRRVPATRRDTELASGPGREASNTLGSSP